MSLLDEIRNRFLGVDRESSRGYNIPVNQNMMSLMNSIQTPGRVVGDISYTDPNYQAPSIPLVPRDVERDAMEETLLGRTPTYTPMSEMDKQSYQDAYQMSQYGLAEPMDTNLVYPKTEILDFQDKPVVDNAVYENFAKSTKPSPAVKAMVEADKKKTAEELEADKDVGFLESIGDFFDNKANILALTLAFNSMRLNPDPNLATVLTKSLERLEDRKLDNKTIVFLQDEGHHDLAKVVANNPKLADYALREAGKRDKWVVATGEELKNDYGIKGLISNKAYRYDKLSKKVEQVGGNATTINNIKPEKGYQFEFDANGNILREVPIPKEKTEEEKKIAQVKEDTIKTDSNIVSQSADVIYSKYYSPDRRMPINGDTTRLTTMSGNTDAFVVSKAISTMKSQASVSNLNAMRAASKTGGALGNVTENELKMLQNKSGILDQLIGNDEDFFKAVMDYERTLMQVIHGVDAGTEIFDNLMKERSKQYGFSVPGISVNATETTGTVKSYKDYLQ